MLFCHLAYTLIGHWIDQYAFDGYTHFFLSLHHSSAYMQSFLHCESRYTMWQILYKYKFLLVLGQIRGDVFQLLFNICARRIGIVFNNLCFLIVDFPFTPR